MDKTLIKEIVHDIVSKLVDRNFDAIYQNDDRKLISANEIKFAIDDYKGILTSPPIESFDSMDVYLVSEIEANVDFDLWYDDKKSDLTLSCNLRQVSTKLVYSIEGIHIL